MDLKQIKMLLEDIFNKDLDDGRRRHIVFWYDDEGEFEEDIDDLPLSNSSLLKLSNNNSFFIKYQLEKVDVESNYLIYAPFAKPAARENYLLDILKYSVEFSTDKVHLIMRDLAISDQNLRRIFRKYVKFFNNKERLKAFKAYGITRYDEEIIDIAIISLLCKLSYPDFDECLRVILVEEEYENNRYIEAINKFGDINVFWRLVDKYFGYSDEAPELEKLAISLMITNVSYCLEVTIPNDWKRYISSKRTDCVLFLNKFMNNNLYAPIYDRLANRIEEKIKVKAFVENWEIEDYIKCDTFKIFDEMIIKSINKMLTSDVGEFDKYKDTIQGRRTKHWQEHFKHEYQCLYWALELLSKWSSIITQGIKQCMPHEFIKKYVEEYYLIDTAYRKFYFSFDKLKNKDKFVDLKEKIENLYVNAYINILGIKWSKSIEELDGDWITTELVLQKDFYAVYVKPYRKLDERVFVIISDALRYEAAKEFSDLLNKERKGSTEISYMQGVIPSYTRLGMASLLPHKTISINGDNNVYVDGISAEDTENRSKILASYCENSIAIQYRDMLYMKRDEYRKTFSGKDVVYIYHNSIDARGHNAKTESEVFDAVEETFEELRVLISNLVNNVTATNVIITAEHGFIYKRGSILESDKVMIQGAGANYVHGGTSIQETLIPVVRFKNDRSKTGKNEIRKVDVKLISITRKITSTIFYLQFFQTEKIEDKRVPRRLKAYFSNEDGNRVSNENIIIADSRSENYAERNYREKFVLKNTKYDRNKKYYLVLEDEEEATERIYDKIPFIIDIASWDDSEF